MARSSGGLGRRLMLLIAGFLTGILGVALGAWFYLQGARVEQVRTRVGENVRYARETIERIDALADPSLHFVLDDVVLRGEAGDTVLASRVLRMTLDANSLQGTGPIQFFDVRLDRPVGRFIQYPAGGWNYERALGLDDPAAAGAEPGRPLLFRDVELADGNLSIAIPSGPPPEEGAAFVPNLPRTVIAGVRYDVYRVNDVQGTLPAVRIGGPDGWRAEFTGLSGDVEQPDLRIAAATGWAEQAGSDAVRFDLATVAIGDSRLAGRGLITFVPEALLYDVTVDGDPLHLADFRPLFPNLPEEGIARFSVDIESLGVERLALNFTELDLDALDSRIVGRIGIAVGGEVPLSLLAADLELAPLRLSALEELGMAEELPVLGQVTGRVTTAGAAEGLALVDLTARLFPRGDPAANPSVILAQGTVALSDPTEALAFDGLSLALRPLRLETFAGVAPDQADRLRGTMEGSVTLAGTTEQLRFIDGVLTYQVADEIPTRLVDLEGQLAMVPELGYRVSAVAQPLSTATIVALFPAAPLRPGTLGGPITIAGTAGSADVTANLSGPAGGIAFTSSFTFGEPFGFDLSGTVNAFAAGMLLQPDLPVEGPLTGSFAARGTTSNLTFNVDLMQLGGRFVLDGTASMDAEPPRFSVAGEVVDFRVGALVGDPQLFPAPMTGPIRVAGGGGDPYAFDLGLRGVGAELVLGGFYLPGEIPVYEARGSVAGLDLSRLPRRGLPTSSLAANVDIRGRGTDLETLEGSFAFDATNSMLGGRPLDAAIGRVDVRGGVAYVDTLEIRYDRTRFAATGTWGLRSPSAEPLRYSLSSPDLGELSRLLTQPGEVPRRIGGSLESAGTVAGSIEYPIIDGVFEGRNLRYEDLRAATLRVEADASRTPGAGWSGDVTLAGTNLVLPGEQLQRLDLTASGSEGAIAFEVAARRNPQTELSATGTVQLAALSPQALVLTDLDLRLEDTAWELMNPTRIQFTADDGAWIDNLVLERRGPVPGMLAIDGRVPPAGAADLTITAREIDLSDFRRISPTLPAVQGILTMDALLSGPVADPEMTLRAEVRQLGYEGATAETVSIEGDYSAGLFLGTAQADAAGARLFSASYSIPMRLAFENMLPVFQRLTTEPLNVSITADSLPLDLVAALVPNLRDGAGLARAQIEVGGTFESLDLNGWARIDRGAFFVEPLNVRYSEIQTEITLADERVQVDNFSARSDGTLVMSGAVDFSAASPRLSITAGLDNFRVIDDPTVARVGVSGQLQVSGSLEEMVLTGGVSIRESTIQVPELAQPEPGIEIAYYDAPTVGPVLTDPMPVGPPLLGNIRIAGFQVAVDESVWLESNEMRVQITGDLVLYREGDELRVFGALETVRGTYVLTISSITREFDVSRGRVQFFGTGDLNPSLDIVAAYRTRAATVGRGGDVSILVQLSGTLLSPRVQLTSDTPVPMSETDIISYLIFGQPSFELGGVNSAFAQQIVVQELMSGIGASMLEGPILRAGLCDWVRVRPGLTTIRDIGRGALTNAAIECGWEIGPNLYLTGQTGLGTFVGESAEGRLGVEWQIDNQWMWEGSYGSVQRNPLARIFDTGVRTQFSTNIRRRWEYGRPSQRGQLDLLTDEPVQPAPGPQIPAGDLLQP